MSKSRAFTFGILACVAAGLVAYFGHETPTKGPSNSAGYCKAQQRYVADKEFIDIAIRTRDSATRGLPNGDFDRTNPNCCLVLRDGNSQRIKQLRQELHTDDSIVLVQLNNETSRVDIKDIGGNKDEILMTVCGQVTELWIKALVR
jgi:hypothetical protein